MKKNGKKRQNDRVLANFSLVRRIAYHILVDLPSSVIVDDLIQSGMVGLLEADENYDPNLGASFETYAGIRIRGEMLDGLRKSDWVPRSVTRSLRKESDARKIVENKKKKPATNREVAEEMNIPFDEYTKKSAYAAHAILHSLDTFPSKTNEDNSMHTYTKDANALSPLEILEHNQLADIANIVLEKMRAKDRFVFKVYCDEELVLREIGNLFSVSESRACQMLGVAIKEFCAGMDLYITGEFNA